MYDEETAAFYDLNSATGAQLKVLTAMSFFPLLLPQMPVEMGREVVRRHLSNPHEFSCAYPLPSVALNDPSFYPKETYALWRGPTWPVINWFLFKRLRAKARVRAMERRILPGLASSLTWSDISTRGAVCQRVPPTPSVLSSVCDAASS
jgi:hypothetical protein